MTQLSAQAMPLLALLTLMLPWAATTGRAQFIGPGTQCSDCSVPLATLGLPHVPQLHTDMPLDCLVAYVAMDSAARSGSIPELLRTPPSLTLDYLRVPARYIFAMKDYDPVLLHRHLRSTMDSAFPNERYGAFYANVIYPVLYSIFDRQEEFGRDYALLVTSDYALHVRVVEVRSGMDSTFHDPQEWTNVACQVVEVFKGQRLPGNCRFNTLRKDEAVPLAQSDCLIYGYRYKNLYEPKPGDEFIVFLDLLLMKEDLYILYPNYAFNTHGGRFRIINGTVDDAENVFGLGTAPALGDFTQAIRQRIADIRTWTLK